MCLCNGGQVGQSQTSSTQVQQDLIGVPENHTTAQLLNLQQGYLYGVYGAAMKRGTKDFLVGGNPRQDVW